MLSLPGLSVVRLTISNNISPGLDADASLPLSLIHISMVVFEWNHAFAGMTATEKWVQGFFNATCPRTAGFSSVGMTTFSVQTLLLMVVLMMIGGGTQSTACLLYTSRCV